MLSLEHLLAPPSEKHLHFLGICGVAMAQLAVELQRLGFHISGADNQCDPPMSLTLAAAGIPILPLEERFAPASPVHLIVVGRAIPVDHPIFADIVARGVPWVSLPELLGHFLGKAQKRVVVAGTKGKTTTTAMLSWITDQAGLRPDYLIGGVPGNFASGLRLANSSLAVLEGDEYASSPTDPSSKFLHYGATAAILTNIHPDHIDLYPEADVYTGLFGTLLANLPAEGFVVTCGDEDAHTQSVLASCKAPVTTVGWSACSENRITSYQTADNETRFEFFGTCFQLPALGRANALDAALAIAAAQHLGVAPADSAAALRTFQPVGERLQKMGIPGGVHFYIDSNAHPASLGIAVATLRESHPTGRLLCIVQPQTPRPGDGYVQRQLPLALSAASHVLIAPPSNQGEFTPPFSCERLVDDLLSRGVHAVYRDKRRSITAWVVENSRPHDTLLLAVHAPSRALLCAEITKVLTT